jgi:hypothetical protein
MYGGVYYGETYLGDPGGSATLAVGKGVSLLWGVSGPVYGLISVPYDVRGSAGLSVTTPYKIIALAGKSLVLRYGQAGRQGKSLGLVFGVGGSAGRGVSFVYSVSALAPPVVVITEFIDPRKGRVQYQQMRVSRQHRNAPSGYWTRGVKV